MGGSSDGDGAVSGGGHGAGGSGAVSGGYGATLAINGGGVVNGAGFAVGGGGGHGGPISGGGGHGNGAGLAINGAGGSSDDGSRPDARMLNDDMHRMVKALFDEKFAAASQQRGQLKDQPRGAGVIGDNGCFQSVFQSLASVVYESPLGSRGIKKQLWLLADEFLGRKQGRPSTNTVDLKPFVEDVQHHLDLDPTELLLDAHTILNAACWFAAPHAE